MGYGIFTKFIGVSVQLSVNEYLNIHGDYSLPELPVAP